MEQARVVWLSVTDKSILPYGLPDIYGSWRAFATNDSI
jgi:hypothetical protein